MEALLAFCISDKRHRWRYTGCTIQTAAASDSRMSEAVRPTLTSYTYLILNFVCRSRIVKLESRTRAQQPLGTNRPVQRHATKLKSWKLEKSLSKSGPPIKCAVAAIGECATRRRQSVSNTGSALLCTSKADLYPPRSDKHNTTQSSCLILRLFIITSLTGHSQYLCTCHSH